MSPVSIRLSASRYLSELASRFPNPATVNASMLRNIITDVQNYEPDVSNMDAVCAALQHAKDEFTHLWAHATVEGTLDFDTLGILQSTFADATIKKALEAAYCVNLKSATTPIKGLFILGLGKLGGRDLNFSSDVDLIAFYDPAKFPVPQHKGQAYIAGKILKTMGQILSPRNSPHFIWRVDWRLRPESSATSLAMPIDAAQDFYFFRALPWHRLALMKARTVAGDHDIGAKFLGELTPFIWRQNLDFRALDELAELKSRINLEHPALRHYPESKGAMNIHAQGFNLKLGRGGIREIEFIANGQQLVWGGKQPTLRTSHTRQALLQLGVLGHLPDTDIKKLRADYIFLRQAENATQMLGNKQTHLVPDTPEDYARFLQILDIEAETFSDKLLQCRKRVHQLFSRLFTSPEDIPAAPRLFLKPLDIWLKKLDHHPREIAENWLDGFGRYGIRKPPHQSKQLAHLLINMVSQAGTAPGSKSNKAIVEIDQFFQSVSRSEQYFHLLGMRPELLTVLIPPLIYSSHMRRLLEQSPHIIDLFLIPNEPSRSGLPDFIFASHDYETRLERLRRYVNEGLFAAYTDVLQGRQTPTQMQAHLAKQADKTLESALTIMADEMKLEDIPICILALGNLGRQKMSPLSDLDLIFIVQNDIDPTLSQKMVRRLRTILTMPLREGIAYELDMRLRPSGRAGPPAVWLQSFEDHHMNRAWTWEHLALTSARTITGNRALCSQLNKVVNDILCRPRNLTQCRNDLITMWHRLETERIKQTSPNIFRSKLRRGGLMQAGFLRDSFELLGHAVPPELTKAIDYWNGVNIWERLLDMEGLTITDIPDYFSNAMLGSLSLPDLSALATQTQYMQECVNQMASNLWGSMDKSRPHGTETSVMWR